MAPPAGLNWQPRCSDPLINSSAQGTLNPYKSISCGTSVATQLHHDAQRCRTDPAKVPQSLIGFTTRLSGREHGPMGSRGGGSGSSPSMVQCLLNLLKFKEKADDEDGRETDLTGAED